MSNEVLGVDLDQKQLLPHEEMSTNPALPPAEVPEDKGVSVLNEKEEVVNTYFGEDAQGKAERVAVKVSGTVRVN